MTTKKVTSMKVDPDVWRDFKIEALKRNVSTADLLDAALRAELKKGSK